MDIADVLYHGCSGSTSTRVRDVGHVPAYQEDNGRFSPLSGTKTDWKYAASEPERDVEIPFPGGVDGRGGHTGGIDLHHPPSKHCHIIYRDKAYYGPMSGGGAVPRSLGVKDVVVTEGTRYKGDTGGGLGGGGGKGIWSMYGRGEGVRYGELKQKCYYSVY